MPATGLSCITHPLPDSCAHGTLAKFVTDTVTVTTVPDATEIVVGGSCIPLYVIVLLNTKSQSAEVVVTVVTVTDAQSEPVCGGLTPNEKLAQFW